MDQPCEFQVLYTGRGQPDINAAISQQKGKGPYAVVQKNTLNCIFLRFLYESPEPVRI
jgi:hypothetical protein